MGKLTLPLALILLGMALTGCAGMAVKLLNFELVATMSSDESPATDTSERLYLP